MIASSIVTYEIHEWDSQLGIVLSDFGLMFSEKSQNKSNGNLLFTGNGKIGPEKMLQSAQLTV